MKSINCPECKTPLAYIPNSVSFQCHTPWCIVNKISYIWDYVKMLLNSDEDVQQ